MVGELAVTVAESLVLPALCLEAAADVARGVDERAEGAALYTRDGNRVIDAIRWR